MKYETDELVGVFIEEASDYLDLLDEAVLALEKDPHNSDLLNEIMRTAHTLKGASGTVGFSVLAELIHATEELVDAVRGGKKKPSERFFEALFHMLDVLRGNLVDIAEGKPESPRLRQVIGELKEVLEDGTHPPPPIASDPRPSDWSDQFTFGEYDRIRIGVCLKQGKQLYVVRVAVHEDMSADADWPAWSRGVHTALRAIGDVITSDPSSVEIKQLGDVRLLKVLFATAQDAIQIRESLLFESDALLDGVEGPHDWGSTAAPQPFDADRARQVEAFLDTARAPGQDEIAIRTASGETIRVSLERIDHLVELIGELVVVESMVGAVPEIQGQATGKLRAYLGQLTKITRDLQEVGMRMRMVAVRGLFKKMRRIVRDLAKDKSKQIRLVMSGESSEIDRSMVERINDPLIHLIRNAVDHGIEPAAERVEKGKSAEGSIGLSAFHRGGKLVISVSDDGRGLDREAILSRAGYGGSSADNAKMTDQEVFNMIFMSGFSTASEVTEVSGRGVGMEVVKREIESLQGRIIVSSEKDKGTVFELVLPLTLAIIDGMLVRVGEETYIIPTLSILESIRPTEDMLHTFFGGFEMIKLRDETIPLVYLGRQFNIEKSLEDPCQGLVVVVESTHGKLGIVVDEVVVQQQIVIKNIGVGLGDTRYLAGAAILSDGSVGLIVNVDELAKLSLGEQVRGTITHQGAATVNANLRFSMAPPPHNPGGEK